MKSRRFVLVTGLSCIAVLAACTQRSATQNSAASPSAASPSAASSSPSSSSGEGNASAPASSIDQENEGAILSSGSFVSGEHPTQGMVRIRDQGEKRILELDQSFMTSTSGPDLVVILHRSPDVIGSTTPPAFPINEGDYVLLAPLREYSGAQSYEIPASVNLDAFKSAAIWCRQFNATFGAAALKPPA